jgi:hypothetical protein
VQGGIELRVRPVFLGADLFAPGGEPGFQIRRPLLLNLREIPGLAGVLRQVE